MILRSSVAALAFAGAVAAAPASPEPALRELRWIAPGADAVRLASIEPAECLTPLPPGDERWSVEIGRAAFRSPLTLGGQAARAGLSCESCHRNGADNPSFFFPGLSGAPGTADVTSSLFSSRRGDGADNPRPIPNLSGDRANLRISRDAGDPALRTFIHGLVTEEFDGFEPPPRVMEGLVAYVRALDPQSCPRRAAYARSSSRDMDNARRAVLAAQYALREGDREAAAFLLAAGRSELARVAERFAPSAVEPLHNDVRRHAIALGVIRLDLDEADSAERLNAWLQAHEALRRRLQGSEAQSLYNRARLAEATGSSAAR